MENTLKFEFGKKLKTFQKKLIINSTILEKITDYRALLLYQ